MKIPPKLATLVSELTQPPQRPTPEALPPPKEEPTSKGGSGLVGLAFFGGLAWYALGKNRVARRDARQMAQSLHVAATQPNAHFKPGTPAARLASELGWGPAADSDACRRLAESALAYAQQSRKNALWDVTPNVHGSNADAAESADSADFLRRIQEYKVLEEVSGQLHMDWKKVQPMVVALTGRQADVASVVEPNVLRAWGVKLAEMAKNTTEDWKKETASDLSVRLTTLANAIDLQAVNRISSSGT